MNHILLIFKLHSYKTREKQFININNPIAEIKSIKKIVKDVATGSSKKAIAFKNK